MSTTLFILITPAIALILSLIWSIISAGPLEQSKRIRGSMVLSFGFCLLAGIYLLSSDSRDSVTVIASIFHESTVSPLTHQEPLLLVSLSIVLLAGAIVAPKRAFESRSALLLFPASLLLYIALLSPTVLTGILAIALVYATLGIIVGLEKSENIADDLRNSRYRSFQLYYGCGIASLVSGVLLDTHFQVDEISHLLILLSYFALVGIFPLHSGALAFFATPRLNPLPTVIAISSLLITVLRYILPVLGDRLPYDTSVLVFSSIGVVHISLMLLVEKRLKRIAALLFLLQAGLLTIELGLEGSSENPELIFVALNMIIANGGLALALCTLYSRFGISGVTSRGGLFSNSPEIGACFLVCTLSLVGFPGTLGFIEGELLVDLVTRNFFVLAAVAFAIAVNGYSIFRIFGRSFFGTGSSDDVIQMPLLLREKIGLFGLITILVLNGVLPRFIAQIVGMK